MVQVRLSPKELRCLWLTARGFNSKEIGGKMGLSRKTIFSNIQRAKYKLGADSITHLIALASKNGYIDWVKLEPKPALNVDRLRFINE